MMRHGVVDHLGRHILVLLERKLLYVEKVKVRGMLVISLRWVVSVRLAMNARLSSLLD